MDNLADVVTTIQTLLLETFLSILHPLMVVGIRFEPMIIQNPFEELEDYGAFLFFFVFYIIVLGGLAAFIVSIMWRFKQFKLKH